MGIFRIVDESFGIEEWSGFGEGFMVLEFVLINRDNFSENGLFSVFLGSDFGNWETSRRRGMSIGIPLFGELTNSMNF